MSSLEARLKRLEQSLSKAPAKTWPDLPTFWCGQYSNPDGGSCCFWHWRGLPRRWGKRHPIYSWQQRLLDDLEAGHRYIYILKPPKLGATELMLSYAIWKALTDPTWVNGQVGILVGTSLGETEQMIARAKDILAVKDGEDRPITDGEGNKSYRVPLHYSYNNKKEFTLNSVKFMAHPAGHYDAIRAKPNMKMIIGDEIAFFIRRKEDQSEIRSAFEHYKGGADTIVALITTAGAAPAGFAYEIFKEEPSLYRKHILTKEDGLEVHPQSGTSLLNPEDVEEKRRLSPATFKREFELQWGYDAGNIFSPEQVDACEAEYDTENRYLGSVKLGIDPGFGTSKFALVVTGIAEGRIRVMYAEEYERPDFQEMLALGEQLIYRYNVEKAYVDGSNPEFIRALKQKFGEDPDYLDPEKKKKSGWWRVVPVQYSTEERALSTRAIDLVTKGWVIVHKEQFKELLSQMRMASVNDQGKLDKTQMQLDLFDAMRLSLYGYEVDRQ